MMVEATKEDREDRSAADKAAGMSDFAASSARLIAQNTALMAMMTAYGIRAASEMTSLMLSALGGSNAAEEASGPAASPGVEPVAEVVPLRPGVPVGEAAPRAKRMRAAKATSTRAPAAHPAPKPIRSRPAGVPRGDGVPGGARKAAASEATPDDRDDLKKISGVGPRVELALNERGINRYSDLAALGESALAELDDELGLDGRVLRDDWAGQASALSGGRG